MNPSQIRAACGLLDWSHEKLASESGLSRPAVQALSTGRSEPHSETLRKIKSAFERHGVEIINGGARWAQDIVTIYEGEDCYLRFLEDAFLALAPVQGEILFSAADERRSPSLVIEKFRTMRRAGITMRSLVRNGDTYLMGALNEYRWMDDAVFSEGDVKAIYGDVVAYLMSWRETPRVVAIKDKVVAQEAARTFLYFWDRSETPPHTTAEVLY